LAPIPDPPALAPNSEVGPFPDIRFGYEIESPATPEFPECRLMRVVHERRKDTGKKKSGTFKISPWRSHDLFVLGTKSAKKDAKKITTMQSNIERINEDVVPDAVEYLAKQDGSPKRPPSGRHRGFFGA
jgi:hypothetical protein